MIGDAWYLTVEQALSQTFLVYCKLMSVVTWGHSKLFSVVFHDTSQNVGCTIFDL